MLHKVKLGLENRALPEFLQLLIKLMLTYVKRSAAVPATKLFKSHSFDSSKGIKHFYMNLLHFAEKMIMCPDQAMFNECFLNGVPHFIHEELVLQNQISVDFSSKEELLNAVLHVDHAMDDLHVINTY